MTLSYTSFHRGFFPKLWQNSAACDFNLWPQKVAPEWKEKISNIVVSCWNLEQKAQISWYQNIPWTIPFKPHKYTHMLCFLTLHSPGICFLVNFMQIKKNTIAILQVNHPKPAESSDTRCPLASSNRSLPTSSETSWVCLRRLIWLICFFELWLLWHVKRHGQILF